MNKKLYFNVLIKRQKVEKSEADFYTFQNCLIFLVSFFLVFSFYGFVLKHHDKVS